MSDLIAESIEDINEISIFKRESVAYSSQIDVQETSYCSNSGLAQPLVSRKILAESLIKSEVHARAIEIIANSVCGFGYTFVDDENAEISGVKDFIDSKIYDLRRNPISFTELNMQLIKSQQTFDEKMLEIVKVNKKPLSEKGNIYFANPKNFYVPCDRSATYITELVDNSWSSNTSKKFGVYNQSNRAHQIYKQTNISLIDANYSIPAWFPVLEKIKLNVLYERFNSEFTANALSADLAVVIEKGRLDDKTMSSLKTALTSYKGALYAGRTILLQAGTGTEFQVRFERINKQEDRQSGYRDDIDANDTKILNAHGVDPKLYGFVQKNGISSGVEQLGAIQVFENMKIKPMRKQLENYWNYLFKQEFDKYNTELRFNTLDMTDAKTDSEIQKNLAETYKGLKEINAPKTMFDETRNSLGLTNLTDEQYNLLMIKETIENIDVDEKTEEE